jgi:glycerol-3-phosphate acyltransferase PlsY
MRLVLAVLLSYLLGSLTPSYWIVKLGKGLDIREYGSGNPGMTNVYRLMGIGPAVVVFLLDVAKGFAAVHWLSCLAGGAVPEIWTAILCAVAVVAGHLWTPFLGFKGGKGVNTAAGAFLALTPQAAVGALLVWALVFGIGRIVSLASICAAVSLPPLTMLVGGGLGQPAEVPVILISALVALALVLRHRENIGRLLKRQEGRLHKIDVSDREDGS